MKAALGAAAALPHHAGAMTRLARISVSCPDRTGLVARITGYLFDIGANLGDSSFAVLGAEADFTAICELPEGIALDRVATELGALPELAGASIGVTPFPLAPRHGPSAHASHYIVITGTDRPGLVARLCETFGDYKANIVWMASETVPGPEQNRYVIRFAVAIPREAEKACLATVANTAETLQLSCTVRAA